MAGYESQGTVLSDSFFDPPLLEMLAAQGYIGFVAADHDLLSGPDNLPVLDPGIVMSPSPAPADCRNFLNDIRNLHQSL